MGTTRLRALITVGAVGSVAAVTVAVVRCPACLFVGLGLAASATLAVWCHYRVRLRRWKALIGKG